MDRRRCVQALAAAGIVVVIPAGANPKRRLRIGLTPVILADQMAFLSRWGRYLSNQIGCEVSFVTRESYQTVLDLLYAGQLDVAWICGYPYVRHAADLELLAVPLYRGQPLYKAYLIRSRHSRELINGWSDMGGKVLAYSDPLSNSGWLVAQAQLAKAGLGGSELKRAFFAHGHRNVAEAVSARLAQAGSMDGYVWDTMQLQGMAAVAKTQVVWESESFGFPPLVTRRGSVHPCQIELFQALLAMPGDETGRQLLRDLNLTGFTAGHETLFDSIRQQARGVAGSGLVA